MTKAKLQFASIVAFAALYAVVAKTNEGICGSVSVSSTSSIEERSELCASTDQNGVQIYKLCPKLCAGLVDEEDDDDEYDMSDEEIDDDNDYDDSELSSSFSSLQPRRGDVGNIFSHAGKNICTSEIWSCMIIFIAHHPITLSIIFTEIRSSTTVLSSTPVVSRTKISSLEIGDCLDDPFYEYIIRNGKRKKCKWLTSAKSSVKVERRKNIYCEYANVKGGCMKTCGTCDSCGNKSGYRFKLEFGSEKKVSCGWIDLRGENSSKTRKRREKHCLKKDGVTARKGTGTKCMESCGFCRYTSVTAVPSISLVPSVMPSSQPSINPSSEPSQSSEAPSLNPSVSVSPSSSSLSPSISSLPSSNPTECEDGPWSVVIDNYTLDCSNIIESVCDHENWGGIRDENGRTASEQCCTCGGSKHKSSEPSLYPSSEPSAKPSQCIDWRYGTNPNPTHNRDWEVTQDEVTLTCAIIEDQLGSFPCNAITAKDGECSAQQACCICGGGVHVAPSGNGFQCDGVNPGEGPHN